MSRRGRPLSSLKALFRLKYLEGIDDNKILAEKLRVSQSTIRKYKYRLNRILSLNRGQNNHPPIDLICPECLKPSFIYDGEAGEKVCTNCGYTEQQESYAQHLSFDTTYALESDLAHGKSLGSSLSKFQLYRVLAKSKSGREDLGIRAKQIKVIAETVDHPTLTAVLKTCYELSKELGLGNDYVFNNGLGRNLRRAFWLVRELELKNKPKTVADTVYWLTLVQFGKDEVLKKVQKKLNVNHGLLKTLASFNSFLASSRKKKVQLPIAKLALKPV